MNNGLRFLTPDDVAVELAGSRVQVMTMLRSGDLPAVKIGGRGQWRVERSMLEEWTVDQYTNTRGMIAKTWRRPTRRNSRARRAAARRVGRPALQAAPVRVPAPR